MSDLSSGKNHKGENFPVASILIAKEHRPPIMAFYRFARAADDIADHPTAPADEKLERLAAMRAGLDGKGAPEAEALGRVMSAYDLDPAHAHDLLDAFVQDVTVNRYETWSELIGYCRLSAMPVGRFVLDVHGEHRATWAFSDALCAALQVINHLQDCAKDHRAINRVYIPTELLAHHGGKVEDLTLPRATPGLRGAIVEAAERTRELLHTSSAFAPAIRSRRLAMEVAVIQRLAEDLTEKLITCDPLSQRVHHSSGAAALIGLRAALGELVSRGFRGS
ncbi:squalene synthase HpnC [Sphingomonas sp. AP4-R1]|uniref:squalene synthase HpnC n=1 Tax=Sphingomonas sp. AP4-R1 TaxID=2735134 RepID=UPI0014937ED9|nr:squalene synthase HpnC [Sphingomonas sp. AP4-R1]QJU57512.1 squalene synthase HpnC [Sphingomonas sp. AP4-R1]